VVPSSNRVAVLVLVLASFDPFAQTFIGKEIDNIEVFEVFEVTWVHQVLELVTK
jgi:hypothetical protein